MPSTIAQLTLIGVAAVIAPILSEVSGRLFPSVVIELLLGVLIGPSVIGWVDSNEIVLTLSDFGLALLMFLAGFELDLVLIRGRPLKLAGMSWLGSLALATAVGLILLVDGHKHGEVVTGLALSTTALGALLPIVRDSGLLATPLGRHVMAVGSIGEFGPIVIVALVLGGHNPGWTGFLLLVFTVAAVLSAFVAHRPWEQRISDFVRRGLHATSQLPVRLSMLLVLLMVWLSASLGLDILLGAFAAGMIVRIAVGRSDDDPDTAVFRGKLEAIGYGFTVPVFFIVSGARLDLSSFRHHPGGLLLIPLFFVLLLVVRGIPIMITYRKELPQLQRRALSLMGATGLPLIVVITTIGVDDGYMSTQAGAALVSAGALSVLLLPTLALRRLRQAAAVEVV